MKIFSGVLTPPVVVSAFALLLVVVGLTKYSLVVRDCPTTFLPVKSPVAPNPNATKLGFAVFSTNATVSTQYLILIS